MLTEPPTSHAHPSIEKMRRWSSVPWNMHSKLRRDRNQDEDQRGVSSSCIIKANPAATKEMRVRMAASQGFLTISFYQESAGSLHAFELCKLTLRDLVVYCPVDGSCGFVLATQMQGKLYHEIYCYPPQNMRETWLKYFRRVTFFADRINLSDISEESERV
jgi:hypothetical protein